MRSRRQDYIGTQLRLIDIGRRRLLDKAPPPLPAGGGSRAACKQQQFRFALRKHRLAVGECPTPVFFGDPLYLCCIDVAHRYDPNILP